MKRSKNKNIKRRLRKKRVRAIIRGTSKRPRLSIFRSNRHSYAQLIDDQSGRTIVSFSTRNLKEKKTKTGLAEALGQKLADLAKKAGVDSAVLDRGQYKYHGRVKAVAEGARKGGLKL
jgi:large subunit ribosomal protein L18